VSNALTPLQAAQINHSQAAHKREQAEAECRAWQAILQQSRESELQALKAVEDFLNVQEPAVDDDQ